MPTPRKHSELIKKWADDKSLVVQFKDTDGQWCDDRFPSFDDHIEFREKQKTILYKVALLNNRHTASVENTHQEQMLEKNILFIKWITPNWIEAEI